MASLTNLIEGAVVIGGGGFRAVLAIGVGDCTHKTWSDLASQSVRHCGRAKSRLGGSRQLTLTAE